VHITQLRVISLNRSNKRQQFRTWCVGAWSWNVGNAGVDALCSAEGTWCGYPTMYNMQTASCTWSPYTFCYSISIQ